MNAVAEIAPFWAEVNESQEAFGKRFSAPKSKVGAKILVVDDEFEVVRALTMRLKHAGYEVVAASDGAGATQAAIVSQPDLIILDIGMPCGDGHTVARRLAENVNTLSTPVIFLTARSSQMDRDLAIDVGVVDYITKPYTASRLLDSVERALGCEDDQAN